MNDLAKVALNQNFFQFDGRRSPPPLL